jgi:hypothetical protein
MRVRAFLIMLVSSLEVSSNHGGCDVMLSLMLGLLMLSLLPSDMVLSDFRPWIMDGTKS